MPRLILTLERDDFQRLAERAQREDRDIRHEERRLLRQALGTIMPDSGQPIGEVSDEG